MQRFTYTAFVKFLYGAWLAAVGGCGGSRMSDAPPERFVSVAASAPADPDEVRVIPDDAGKGVAWLIVTEPDRAIAPWTAVARRRQLVFARIDQLTPRRTGATRGAATQALPEDRLAFVVIRGKADLAGLVTGLSWEQLADLRPLGDAEVARELSKHAWAPMRLPSTTRPQ